jgi:two-component system, LytTR family, sensor kinase
MDLSNLGQNKRNFFLRQLIYLITALAISEFDLVKPISELSIANFLFLYGFLFLISDINYLIIRIIHNLYTSNNFKLLSIFLQILIGSLLSFLLLLVYKYLQIGKIVSVGEIALFSLIISIMITTLFEANYFFTQWKNYIIRSEKMEKANLVAKYETLKKQVHPHFLFNSLNTLVGLIENNDTQAGEYTQKLADFFKYLLTYQQKESISLKEELDIVKQYTFIQQVRFNSNLQIEYKIKENLLTKKVPPLTVQMLVENAIKHNVISNNYPLIITIESINDSSIVIENNKQKKQHVESASVGLENIKERYKYLCDKIPEIIESEKKFTVILPLI